MAQTEEEKKAYRREYAKAYYAKHRDVLAAKNKEYYAAHLEIRAAYYRRNRTNLLAYHREHYVANKSAIQARKRVRSKQYSTASNKRYYEANKAIYLARATLRRWKVREEAAKASGRRFRPTPEQRTARRLAKELLSRRLYQKSPEYVVAQYNLPKDTPPELIEALRISLFIKREIRKQSHDQS